MDQHHHGDVKCGMDSHGIWESQPHCCWADDLLDGKGAHKAGRRLPEAGPEWKTTPSGSHLVH